jgi:hypothetical protein
VTRVAVNAFTSSVSGPCGSSAETSGLPMQKQLLCQFRARAAEG